MNVVNQVILGVTLMVTLIVVALMVRVYSKTSSVEPKEETSQNETFEDQIEQDDV